MTDSSEGQNDTENPSKRISRCDAHEKGSMLNPLSFDEISRGAAVVYIEFSGQLYNLSRTRLGKLILTKAADHYGPRE